MGYDWITCYYPLPDAQAQDIDFQTKSLNCQFDCYEVSREGRLLLPRYDNSNNLFGKADMLHHGIIQIYGEWNVDRNMWFCYNLEFVKGQLKSLYHTKPFWKE